MISLASLISLIWPSAIICTAIFPNAVASTGPAATRQPVALAVIWQSRLLWIPPPIIWIVSYFLFRQYWILSSSLLYFIARLWLMQHTISPGVSGTVWPVCLQYSRILRGILPDDTNSSALASTKFWNNSTSFACVSSSPKLYSLPSRIHCLLLSCTIQRPVRFLRKLIFPP